MNHDHKIKRICVFCGSSPGSGREYQSNAEALGEVLVQNKIGLVYGGAKVGLMGKIARTVLEGGGEVIGVIPRALADREIAFREITDLRIVESMHERKALMAELADGFIALPGGLGTIEEFFEAWAWSQLGLHTKPCALLNINGYFDHLLEFLDHAIAEQFIKSEYRSMVVVSENPVTLLEMMKRYTPPPRIDKVKWARAMSKSL